MTRSSSGWTGSGPILAQTAARDPSLFVLLDKDVEISDAARRLKRKMQVAGGLEPDPEIERPGTVATTKGNERQVVPPSVAAAQLANPFLAPDFTAAEQHRAKDWRLTGWELIGPLLSSFENAAPGAPSCMDLPDPTESVQLSPGLELMPHQARLLAAAARGHRTFLLADEPGLGKTAQALLAAQAANAYPLLCVVPSVVKTNWAREAAQWTPSRSVAVIHGSGETIDGFANIVVVNYEVLDRHVGWIASHGFRGMVVDEAHFIKNKKSQRSQHVLEIADSIRHRAPQPLMMALTGTPLINDIDDFRAIWQFLGWIQAKQPRPVLMAALEETGLTPVDHGFYPAARQAVIDLGIVRRRKNRRGQGPAGPTYRRPASRARLRRRPFHPRGRAGAGAAAGSAVRRRRRRPSGTVRQVRGGHRPRSRTAGGRLGTVGWVGVLLGRERLRDGSPYRSGKGQPGRRLRRTAGS